jgi:hypothetical protein
LNIRQIAAGCVIILTIATSGCAGSIQAELYKAEHDGKPIFISTLAPTKPDKSGISSARARFFNTSAKIYKYVDISVTAYNRVGDAIPTEGHTLAKLRFTGPLRPRRSPGVTTWPAIWRDAAIACVVIARVDILHLDGTAVTIEGAGLATITTAGINHQCPAARS